MASTAAKLLSALVLLALPVVHPQLASAQASDVTLSGVVSATSGAVVAGATVSVKNLATGRSIETKSDSSGAYHVPDLSAGDYEVSVSAGGFGAKTAHVTLTSLATRQTLNVTLAPSTAGAPLSLSDLGFQPNETQGSAEEQARLEKRSSMLKTHQRLGLITTAPLVATVIAGNFAGGRQPSRTGRQVHAALGATTAGLYFLTASYAIRAPKIKGTRVRGPIRWHRALAWVHGTGMVLTPVLGAMAYAQRSRGERVHGIARFHGPVGIITAGAYGAGILSVSVKF